MENRQCSTAVHTALTLVVAALLTICVAPVVHLATPTDGWLDLAAARALDGVDSVMPGELWLSNALKGTGATLFNPGGWHGPQTWTTSGSPTAGFFEGWYYKCVTASRRTFVLIPGGIYSKTKENTFAFIIFVNPAAESTADRVKLFKYPIDALTYTKGLGAQWSVRIGESTFGPDSVSVKLVEPDNGTVHLEGDLALAQSQSWPASVLMPDVMGWFAWVPGMECRHGVVSLDAVVTGELFVREKPAGFSTGGGKAYVEKDWGTAFPRTWVWMQSNHFVCDASGGVPCSENATLLLSIASIPFPSNTLEAFRFRGFLGALRLGDTIYRFATYQAAVIERCDISTRGAVTVTIRSAQHRLQVWALGDFERAALLHGPTPGGAFEPFVREMLGAEVKVKLIRRSDGLVLFEGVGKEAGLEIESMDEGGFDLLR
eukprot:m.9755 g.9755  ORF g.9755 m.9755 type:complete len:431 (-) comp4219_c0_seq1:1518-2810(-)